MAKQPKKPTHAQLEKAVEKLWRYYQHRSNVTAADRGYIWHDGKETTDIGLRIHVANKIPKSELESSQIFPTEFEGLPLDVISGDYRSRPTSTEVGGRQTSPMLMGGLSCGPLGRGAGTLGAIVIDEISGKPSILSNWHVLAGPDGFAGAPIMQPATIDGGDPQTDVVAHLGRFILDQDGDAALAPLVGNRPWLPVVSRDYTPLSSIRDSRLGETLKKSGRTTGTTVAKVDGEGLYRVEFEVARGRFETRTIRGFKLVSVEPGNPDNLEISDSGDSGCIWYDEKNDAAVGLHFAGETNQAPGYEHAIACNMSTVSERLGFRMATFDDLLQDASAWGGAQRAASQTRTQLTPHPDWPDPTWPWPWPFPIDGPWGPWPPRPPWDPWGPWGPHGPGGPRPIDPFGPRPLPGNSDLNDPRDFGGGMFGDISSGGMTRSESAQAQPSISVDQTMWPALQAALIEYGYAGAGSYTQQTKTTVLTGQGSPATVLRIVIARSDRFWNDGVRLHSADLQDCPRFVDVLYVIAQAYVTLGYKVVA